MTVQTLVKSNLMIEGIESLVELALDLRWSWNHGSDEVWQKLDPELWELTHNAWVILKTVSQEKIKRLLNDPSFSNKVNEMVEAKRALEKSEAWFQENHPQSALTSVAYFSMEFMLSESLPIYSGGLGNVAGDQLKTASDLGVPVVGVGLLYQQGYFHQVIDKNGVQQALYPYNDPGQLPISPLRGSNGEWLRLEIALPGYSVWLRAWHVKVGRVKLLLLDSNDAANHPIHRGITSELYGGGSELRLKQELVLGIGGWRLLSALGIKPEVCHLNEGHAAFAILERAKSFMEETGNSFDVALAATRAGNLFTTHTAVPAGFDRFSPDLIEQYLGSYAQNKLKIPLHDLLALGRKNPNDSSEYFNMAYLALHGSGAVNGVSRLHGKVSRHIFGSLFEKWPESEVPVEYVTNGVHMPSWDSIESDEFWTQSCGKDRWLGPTEVLQRDIRCVSDENIWQLRSTARKRLIEYARKRLSKQLIIRGEPSEEVELAKKIFNPETLTLGFARRFATYKRPNMLLHDPERFIRLLTNTERPVQLILAGKAHPQDKPGQDLIKQWIEFIKHPQVRPHVIFLSDYDMLLTEHLVPGADVWINTPRRPWEASGTSGMKVLVNGGLNLSELDGWWAEAYTPEVGWAIGDGQEHDDDVAWDAAEAHALYDVLEYQVIPEFYNRNNQGIPKAWVSRIRESMARLTPHYSANRAVREYTTDYYLPAADAYMDRTAQKGALARQIVKWKQTLDDKWQVLHFSGMKTAIKDGQYEFEVELYYGELDPAFVKVELYAESLENSPPVKQEMTRVGQMVDRSSTHVFRTTVPITRPATDYTPRIIPYNPKVSIPLEMSKILWQH